MLNVPPSDDVTTDLRSFRVRSKFLCCFFNLKRLKNLITLKLNNLIAYKLNLLLSGSGLNYLEEKLVRKKKAFI